MTDDRAFHESVVDQWMRRANGFTPARLLDLLEASLGSMWNRARPALGDRTLVAIVGRVLYTASEVFPFLGSVRVERAGIRFDELRLGLEDVAPAELSRAVRFVVLELLEVLGHLTAGILTPALHAELATARIEGSYPRSGRARSGHRL